MAHVADRARVLFAEGRYSAALSVFGSDYPDDPALGLACAEALNEVGQSDRALELAERLGRIHKSDNTLAAGLRRVVAGVHLSRGELHEGIQDFQAAISMAEAAGDHTEAARAALKLFSCVHNVSGTSESSRVLTLAKLFVLQTNQPRLLAELHARVGQADAQNGELRVARRHLDRAIELLRDHPQYASLARTKLSLSSTLALLSRNDEASRHALEALEAAEIAGGASLIRSCRANLAQLQFRTGAFESAREIARTLLELRDVSGALRLAVLETYVATLFELSECTDSSSEVGEFLQMMASQADPSWIAVEAVPTQARILQHLRGVAPARDAIRIGRERSDQREHPENVCRLWLVEAELIAEAGDTVTAEALLSEAVAIAGDSPSAEIIGLLERAKALVAAGRGSKRMAHIHFRRSERVLRGCALRTEANRTKRLRRAVAASSGQRQPELAKWRMQRLGVACELTFLAALAPYPRVLAREFSQAARRLKLATSVSVTAAIQPRTAVVYDEVRSTLYCGQEAGTDVLVEYRSATDYPSRHLLNALVTTVSRAVELEAARNTSARLANFLDLDVAPEGKKGLYISAAMKHLLAQVRQVAPTELPVLITGETGTGKEVVAAEVHALSRRAERRFIAVNVNAVPRDMLEGQLFGYRRGAFTGAVSDVKGLVREAEGGTLFLDEIGELSPDLQPKLLRFLESGEIQPLGERPQHVDVRVIAATNADLVKLVGTGRFREDLYYRLNVVSLAIPPLRDRREEIPTLINHFMTQHARVAGKPLPQLSSQALERLSAFEWPGNVRQLTNELKRIVALQPENEMVECQHLSEELRRPAAEAPRGGPAPGDVSFNVRLDQPLEAIYADVDRAALTRALQLTSNNQSDAARRLGITRKGLYLKRRRLGLGEDHT